MTRKFAHKLSGFTMVELMIGMVLGMLVAATVIALFLGSKRSYTDNERTARLQENGRVALFLLADDLRHADFWGPLLRTSDLTPLSGLTGPCGGWAANIGSDRLIGSTDAKDDTAMGCIGAGDIKDNTSAVGIKRVSGTPVALSNIPNGRFILRANSASGSMIEKSASTPAPAAEMSDWEYQPKIYFIRRYAAVDGDGIPSLCVVAGNPNPDIQCLVDGVEDMHIEYGVDADDNGVPDSYQTAPTANTVSAKVYLLIRDLTPDYGYTDTKIYQLGSKTVAALKDNFHRAVFSTTVIAYNRRTLPVRKG